MPLFNVCLFVVTLWDGGGQQEYTSYDICYSNEEIEKGVKYQHGETRYIITNCFLKYIFQNSTSANRIYEAVSLHAIQTKAVTS